MVCQMTKAFYLLIFKKKFHKFAGDLVFMAAYKVRLGNFKKKKKRVNDWMMNSLDGDS